MFLSPSTSSQSGPSVSPSLACKNYSGCAAAPAFKQLICARAFRNLIVVGRPSRGKISWQQVTSSSSVRLQLFISPLQLAPGTCPSNRGPQADGGVRPSQYF